jgi:hypothetical protein
MHTRPPAIIVAANRISGGCFVRRTKQNRKLSSLRIKYGIMQFGDFEEQIFSIDRAIHREMPKAPVMPEIPAPKDLTELRATLRRAVEGLILCNDLDQGVSRLRRQAEAWSAIKTLTLEAPLSRDDHRSAARRAFEATPRKPNSLPFYPYCSYLLELCNGLELARHR